MSTPHIHRGVCISCSSVSVDFPRSRVKWSRNIQPCFSHFSQCRVFPSETCVIRVTREIYAIKYSRIRADACTPTISTFTDEKKNYKKFYSSKTISRIELNSIKITLHNIRERVGVYGTFESIALCKYTCVSHSRK